MDILFKSIIVNQITDIQTLAVKNIEIYRNTEVSETIKNDYMKSVLAQVVVDLSSLISELTSNPDSTGEMIVDLQKVLNNLILSEINIGSSNIKMKSTTKIMDDLTGIIKAHLN